MSRLPRISGREVVKALRKIGFEFDHQRGSHIVLRHTAPPHRRLTVPDHSEVAIGTLRAIIRQAGLTVEKFVCSDLGSAAFFGVARAVVHLIQGLPPVWPKRRRRQPRALLPVTSLQNPNHCRRGTGGPRPRCSLDQGRWLLRQGPWPPRGPRNLSFVVPLESNSSPLMKQGCF